MMDLRGVQLGLLLLSLHVVGLTSYVLTYLLSLLIAMLCNALFYGLLVYLYTRVTMGFCVNNESMAGKCVIVTGGTSGIGLETAQELAKKGAKVIIGARKDNPVIIEAIKKNSGSRNVEFWELDLMESDSIHSFAQKVQSKGLKIDVLVNNAGIYKPKQGSDENSIQTNYLGHFELTTLLKSNL